MSQNIEKWGARMKRDFPELGPDDWQPSEVTTRMNAEIQELRAALAAQAGQSKPVAWRYQDARGHYRFRAYVPNFDAEYAILKPVPLYAHPAPVRQPHEIEPYKVAFEVALTTLQQIASTPRNKGARQSANATAKFLETQLTEITAQKGRT